jgi:hypothetical protein
MKKKYKENVSATCKISGTPRTDQIYQTSVKKEERFKM